jgi:hypothetical protein
MWRMDVDCLMDKYFKPQTQNSELRTQNSKLYIINVSEFLVLLYTVRIPSRLNQNLPGS